MTSNFGYKKHYCLRFIYSYKKRKKKEMTLSRFYADVVNHVPGKRTWRTIEQSVEEDMEEDELEMPDADRKKMIADRKIAWTVIGMDDGTEEQLDIALDDIAKQIETKIRGFIRLFAHRASEAKTEEIYDKFFACVKTYMEDRIAEEEMYYYTPWEYRSKMLSCIDSARSDWIYEGMEDIDYGPQ